MDGGRPGVGALRGSRLLTDKGFADAIAVKTALIEQARAIGFSAIGITDPGAI